MSLRKMPAMGLEQYAEHTAAAQAHFTISKNLGRSGHFHEAATAHYNQAVHHRNEARELAKSSPRSSIGWKGTATSYHAHEQMYQNRANN